jgi:hypothetical protein
MTYICAENRNNALTEEALVYLITILHGNIAWKCRGSKSVFRFKF